MSLTLALTAAILTLAIVGTLFCRPIFREEDRMRMFDPIFKVVTYSRRLVYINWVVGIIFGVMVLCVHDREGQMVLAGTALVTQAISLATGYFRRSNYYTADDERITYVKKGELAWSHKWTEVQHVRKRIVSMGKTTTVFYDLTATDGSFHKNLPQSLGKILKQHTEIEFKRPNYTLMLIVVAIVVCMLIFIGLTSK